MSSLPKPIRFLVEMFTPPLLTPTLFTFLFAFIVARLSESDWSAEAAWAVVFACVLVQACLLVFASVKRAGRRRH